VNAPEPVSASAGAAGRSIAEALAEFAAGLAMPDVPPPVGQRAKYLVLDALGCAFAACREPFAARIAAPVARLAGAGTRGVIGMELRLPLRDAALLNGMLVHGLDYDDTHPEGVIHLGASVLPAALGAAAEAGASGAELLAAYVAGVEAGARLASVAAGGFHRAGFHPTGLVGAFAASLVAGRLARLDAAQLARAQGIALSLASGSLQFLDDGAWTKRLHPGWAAACGITAAALAAERIPAPCQPYEGRYGLFRSHLLPKDFAASDLGRATAGLGERWELVRVSVKPWPACHLVHGCVEAAIALHREGVDASRVRAVRARVPAQVVEVVCEPLAAKRRPKDGYDARFSLPYAVASALARGRLGLAELDPEALREPRLEALMDRFEYASEEASTFPRHYSGEVTVELDDGRRLGRRVAVNLGNPERPLAEADIEAKFFDNCTRSIPEPAARRVRDLVLGLESYGAAELEAALASASRGTR